MRPAKTAKAIEMPFGVLTQVGVGNHVLDIGADPQGQVASFGGSGGPL